MPEARRARYLRGMSIAALTDLEPAIVARVDGRPRALGGVAIARVLPAVGRRMVGPFGVAPAAPCRRGTGPAHARRAPGQCNMAAGTGSLNAVPH